MALAAIRNERAQAVVAQVEATPKHDPEVDAKEHVTENWTAGAQMRCDRPTEIAGQQDRAQYGCPRVGVKRRTDETQNAEATGKSHARRVPELSGRRDDDIERNELDASVKQHEQDDQAAQTMAGPGGPLVTREHADSSRPSRRHLALSCSSADRPGRPKSIDQHAECFGKEGLLHRQDRHATLHERIERRPRLAWGFIAERDGEALHALIGMATDPVACHQPVAVFESKLPMHHLVVAARRPSHPTWRVAKLHQNVQFCAEYLRIEAHGFGSGPVKGQVGVKLRHHASPFDSAFPSDSVEPSLWADGLDRLIEGRLFCTKTTTA